MDTKKKKKIMKKKSFIFCAKLKFNDQHASFISQSHFDIACQ